MAEPLPPSLAHLRDRLALVEARVRALVDARRTADPDPDDPYRGLYVSEDHVDALLAGPTDPAPHSDPAAITLLAGVEEAAERAAADGADIRLHTLGRSFSLTPMDVEILLTAIAPEVDPRYEQLYGYLNDDITRRRASVGLVLQLLGRSLLDGPARASLGKDGRLVTAGLVVIDDEPGRSQLSRMLSVPDRVVGHLLGSDDVDARLRGLLVDTIDLDNVDVDRLSKTLGGASDLVHLRDRVGSATMSIGASAVSRSTGRPALVIDLDRLGPPEQVGQTVRAVVRDARLTRTGIVAGPVETLATLDREALRLLVDAPVPRVLLGDSGWDPGWGTTVPLTDEGPVLPVEDRASLWRAAIAQVTSHSESVADAAEATVAFRLSPEQIHRAARTAGLVAASQSRPVNDNDLQLGARAQNAVGLERLALRIQPKATWDDLVVNDNILDGLQELVLRSRQRDVVLGEWGLRANRNRGSGVTGLLAGPSGTGKTLAAEVVAGELGLDLYVVDLATVIDKYIGETEKNLDRLFGQADRVNGVLLFDEADALFGKRSEVSDAHDRHANVEVAYLLQRMEQFDGIALLTTNLRSNIDEAFTRRLDAIVEFPAPDADQRRALWQGNLTGRGMPVTDDVDLDFLAERFKLSGGEISNIALTAAYIAAGRRSAVNMLDLVRATAREYRKLGRLTVEAEFGTYYALLTSERDAP